MTSANRVRHHPRPRSHRAHHDAPDTATEQRDLTVLPEGPERDRLREEVVRAWLPMAHRIAGRYRDRGESLDDLRQVAAVGLVKAVDGYDPGRGAFESYAVPTITGEVRRHFRDHTWTVRVPRRTQDLRGRVRGVHQELSQSGHEPSEGEIAERTGLDTDDVREGLSALHAYSALSLDADLTLGEAGETTLADTLGGRDPDLDKILDREAVKPLLAELPEREQRLLYLRYFQGFTQTRIAEEFGVSQMHVSRLLSTTCTRLRERLSAG
ncbi:SigB/SigF/SigG family RNA polymerase sigma factor [Streptomyces sp. NPDC091377]|uniref:SigB/SigF/SigG family RNA polymerase sigma factor n=1 Tax=unclassified Streptomyces TaxID=2593676 RepID=UPI0038171572